MHAFARVAQARTPEVQCVGPHSIYPLYTLASRARGRAFECPVRAARIPSGLRADGIGQAGCVSPPFRSHKTTAYCAVLVVVVASPRSERSASATGSTAAGFDV
jgi:hypothetical protein